MKKVVVAVTLCLPLVCAVLVANAAQTSPAATTTASSIQESAVAVGPMNGCPADTPAWPIYKSLNVGSTRSVTTTLAEYRLLIGEYRFCSTGGYGLDASLSMDSPFRRGPGFVFCGEAVNYADNGIIFSSQSQAKTDGKAKKPDAFEWYYVDKLPRTTPAGSTNTYNNTGRPQYIVGEVVTAYAKALPGADEKRLRQECLTLTQETADAKAAEVLKQINAHQRP